MAEKRMFAQTIIDSDAFLEMPLSTQALYFHLCMRADDEGFVNNPKKIQRMVGGSDDDFKLLIAKSFIISFDAGIVVIKHWRIHNYIRKDRIHETKYLEEKAMLTIKENGAYSLLSDKCQSDVSQVTDKCQARLDKSRVDKNRVDKNNNICVPGEKSPSYDEDFETLWKSYPKERRKEKLDAKAKFLAYVTTGATYKRKKYKFTIDEIYEGFNWYINNTKEEPGDEPYKYWKLFNTLMYNIPEYIERAREENDK